MLMFTYMSSPEAAPQLLDRPDRKLVLRGDGKLDPAIGKIALSLTGVDKPRMLIIPTAAPSIKYYRENVGLMQAMYEQMGADVKVLHEFGKLPTNEEVREAFEWADAYDGTGGSTKNAVRDMTRTGIRRAIKNFRGVGAGGSATYNTHFKQSLSWNTPRPETHPEENAFIDVDGLQYTNEHTGEIEGIVNVLEGSPHADFIEGNFKDYPGEDVMLVDGVLQEVTDPRSVHLSRSLERQWASGETSGIPIGLATDNDAAIVFDGSGRFWAAQKEHAVKHDGSGYPVGVTAWHQSESGLAIPRLFTPAEGAMPIAALIAPPLAA